MDELLRLTRENNEMLKRIVAYVDKIDTPKYRDNKAFEDFISNLVADLIGSRIECGNSNQQIFNR